MGSFSFVLRFGSHGYIFPWGDAGIHLIFHNSRGAVNLIPSTAQRRRRSEIVISGLVNPDVPATTLLFGKWLTEERPCRSVYFAGFSQPEKFQSTIRTSMMFSYFLLLLDFAITLFFEGIPTTTSSGPPLYS